MGGPILSRSLGASVSSRLTLLPGTLAVMMLLGRFAPIVVLSVGLVAAGCADSATPVTDPPSTTTAPTTTITVAPTIPTTIAPTTTTTVAGEGLLVTRCGAAVLPLGSTAPVGEPVNAEAEQAFDEAGESVGGEWFGEGLGFGGGWVWVVVDRDDDRIVFLGQGPNGFADVVIEHDGEGWKAVGWGGCHFLNTSDVPGFSAGAWVTDPDVEPDPASATLHVLVMERSCAGGQPPEDREIRPLVFAGDDSVQIVVLIEPVQGGATCPSNPWYATTFDLGEPLGDRVLIDGRVTPGLERPWPPTEASLFSGGDEE